MAGFLYFLPSGPNGPTLQDMAARGLAYAFPRPPVPRPVSSGPGDGAGVICAHPGDLADLAVGYFPDAQTWQKHPHAEAWVGLYRDQVPGPVNLMRDDPVPGHTVTLGDGRPWLVPVARGLAETEDAGLTAYETLPRTTTLDDAGQWVPGGLLPRFQTLWETALAWWDAKAAADVTEKTDDSGEGARAVFDFAGAHDAALVALAANYRIGKPEAAMLGIFNPMAVLAILDALIDWPTLLVWLKKKAQADDPLTPAPSSTPAGPPDSAPATAPPSPTCGPSPPKP